MANPDDDRGEAAAWYLRLLILQELEKGTERKALLARLGISKGHLSQIESGRLGVGLSKLIPFAEALGYQPGQLLDEALRWWPKHGKRMKARALAEAAQAATKGSDDSGEHKSQPPFKVQA